MSSLSSRNLDFLRWKYGTHEALQKELDGILNWNELSEYALGKKQMSPYRISTIEERLSLPKGWIERDNLSLLEISETDFALFKKIKESKQGVKEALIQLISSISEP
jgi:hypothetical protein